MDEPAQTVERCLIQFSERFFTDVADAEKSATIQCKLGFHVIRTYNAERPTNNLNLILEEFKNCAEPIIGSAATITATKVAETIFYIVILTAVFMILVVIILGSLDKKLQSGIIIGLVAFFALLYIITGWLLVHSSFLTISDEITSVERMTDNCLQNTVNSIETYFNKQETALNDSLCAYPLICNPFGEIEL